MYRQKFIFQNQSHGDKKKGGKEYRQLRKEWTKESSITGNFQEDSLMALTMDLVLTFRATDLIFEGFDRDFGKRKIKEIRMGPTRKWQMKCMLGVGFIRDELFLIEYSVIICSVHSFADLLLKLLSILQ
jgi:hypothetical protein